MNTLIKPPCCNGNTNTAQTQTQTQMQTQTQTLDIDRILKAEKKVQKLMHDNPNLVCTLPTCDNPCYVVSIREHTANCNYKRYIYIPENVHHISDFGFGCATFWQLLYRETYTDRYDTIVLVGGRGLQNMAHMFDAADAGIIDFSYLDTSRVYDMSNMFNGARIEKINLKNVDTSCVENMAKMFYYCNTQSLNLSSFNIYEATCIDEMFDYCTANTRITNERLKKVAKNRKRIRQSYNVEF